MTKKATANIRPAKVIWHDACGGKTGWLSETSAKKYTPQVCTSYGWLVNKDRNVVTLALSRHNNEYADTLDIPRKMVKSIRFVR